MKQEYKDLLLRYLSMALPYGVKVQEFDDKNGYKLLGIDGDWLHIDCPVFDEGDGYVEVEYCKAYLRPMSSMTEVEKKEFDNFCVIDEFVWEGKTEIGYKNQAIIMSVAINWLLKKHFDFMDLIPKGLAIEVTEENYG